MNPTESDAEASSDGSTSNARASRPRVGLLYKGSNPSGNANGNTLRETLSVGLELIEVDLEDDHQPLRRSETALSGWVLIGDAEPPTPEPHLPIVRDRDLASPEDRDHFVERVFGFRRVRDLFKDNWRGLDLVAFNVSERFRVIAHDPKKHKLIGRLVAKLKDHPREFLETEITSLYMTSLEKPVTRRKHANVLENVLELLEPKLESSTVERLAASIKEYKSGSSPLLTPLTLLRHHVQEQGLHGLEGQSYLFPEPNELNARFHG